MPLLVVITLNVSVSIWEYSFILAKEKKRTIKIFILAFKVYIIRAYLKKGFHKDLSLFEQEP